MYDWIAALPVAVALVLPFFVFFLMFHESFMLSLVSFNFLSAKVVSALFFLHLF
jgi:hypothetical protein